MKVKIKELTQGMVINHEKYGCIQYSGLATKHPYTNEQKVPYRYVFWLPIDEDGQNQPDVVLTNGDEIVELVD